MSVTKRSGFCAYCGRRSLVEREHVVPLGLFPVNVRGDTNFVLVDSCSKCNSEFSEHEDDFRNFCTLAGPDNQEARDLFHGQIKRSFARGRHSRAALGKLIEKTFHDPDLKRMRIKPDAYVFFCLRKIVRGLADYNLKEVIGDNRVEVVVCPFKLPKELIKPSDFNVLHPTVFEYWFSPELDRHVHSLWVLRILETRVFVGLVHP